MWNGRNAARENLRIAAYFLRLLISVSRFVAIGAAGGTFSGPL